MNGLSLFNGMGCFEIALIELGIQLDTIYTSEIDKHALNQTRLNFPNDIELGDVRNIDVSKLKPIHIVVGGSPCQSFSFAGKRKGMAAFTKPKFVKPTKSEWKKYISDKQNVMYDYDDFVNFMEEQHELKTDESFMEHVEIYTLEKYLELKSEGFEFEGQSYLFWEFMRILNDIRKYNPDVLFLLENVEMGNKWERVLSEAIGIYGVHINSALVSAQNRKRIYWTNFRTRQEGLFGELHSDIPQPEDKGILLRDILESDVPEKYYLSDKTFNYLSNRSDLKQKKGCGFKFDIKDNLELKSSSIGVKYGAGRLDDTYIKVDKQLNPKANQDKASCFTAGAHSGGNHSDMDLIACLTPKRTEYGKKIRKKYEAGEVSAMRKEVSQLEPREDGKTNTLTTVHKDNLVMRINGPEARQGERIYNIDGQSPALLSNMSCQTHAILELNERQQRNLKQLDGKADTFLSTSWKGSQANGMPLVNQTRIRRLTPTECARLQTVPEWYQWACSDTQEYRMLGNGWTIAVIMHILSFLPEEYKNIR